MLKYNISFRLITVTDSLLHNALMLWKTSPPSETPSIVLCCPLLKLSILLTQELKLTMSKKDQGCHRQCLTLAV